MMHPITVWYSTCKPLNRKQICGSGICLKHMQLRTSTGTVLYFDRKHVTDLPDEGMHLITALDSHNLFGRHVLIILHL